MAILQGLIGKYELFIHVPLYVCRGDILFSSLALKKSQDKEKLSDFVWIYHLQTIYVVRSMVKLNDIHSWLIEHYLNSI